jgi:hypothetical protein
MRGRRPAALLLSGAALVGAVACRPAGGTGVTGVVHAGSASELVAAYGTAKPGTTIELDSGVYAPKQLRRHVGAPALDEPVTLRAAPGAEVEVKALDVGGPALRVQGLHLTGIVRFRAAAVGSSLEDASVVPGTVIVEGDDVTISGNRITAAPDRDALDIGATDGSGPRRVVVHGNVLGPGSLTPGSPAHVDCLQVMSAEQLVVNDNVLYDCPAQTLLVKSDLGPVREVRIARNALRGCRPRTSTCPAFMTLQIVPGAHPMSDIEVDGNSVAGALRAVGSIPGLELRANAIDRVEDGCEHLVERNVLGSARCQIPPGNLVAAPQWTAVDASPPDLRPTSGSPTRDAGATSMERDADGRSTACGSRWDAGAFERCP